MKRSTLPPVHLESNARPAPLHVVGAALVISEAPDSGETLGLGEAPRRSHVLAARRAPHKADAGRWELPGGKIEPGETAEAALQRELLEELGVRVAVGRFLGRGVGRGSPEPRETGPGTDGPGTDGPGTDGPGTDGPDPDASSEPPLDVVLDVYVARLEPEPIERPVLASTDHDRLRWITAETLDELDWAEADRPVLPALRALLDGSDA